ncbi:MAG: hypothetical protein KBA60_00670 [Flavobacteriales bacterium]|nr:hypothetical protein [Flavobacteriales bacterium]MBP7154490.1 hypothetical protein [Flavobacteriales bacterium]HQV74251.1 hypothetical protein [Flavobacteriales bacterium]HQW40195.1 hypothetical protein [Flavobacteriales bacterium]
MKNPLLLVTVLCAILGSSSNLVQGQEIKLKAKISEAAYNDDVLLPKVQLVTTENSLVVLSSNEGEGNATALQYRLELYGTDKLELMRTIEPVRKAPAGVAAIETALMFGGRSILIGSQRRPAENLIKLYWQQFDPRLARNNAPFLDLVSLDLAPASAGSALTGDGAAPLGFQVTPSPDGSKMLLAAGDLPLANGRTLHVFLVVDKDMQVLWQQVVVSNGEMKSSHLHSAVVDNKGTCTAWLGNTMLQEPTKEGVGNVATKVYRMSSEGVVEADFKMRDNYWPASARLLVLDSGAVACSGVFGSKMEKKDYTPGTFLALLAKGEYEFKQMATTKFPSRGQAGEKPYENMRTANFLLGPKGSTFLVCEVGDLQDAVVTSTFGRNTNVTERIHGDIVAQSFSAVGASNWMTVIPRNTKSISHLLGKTQSLVYDGRLNIFTLDDEATIAQRLKGERSAVAVATEGTRTLHHAFDTRGGYISRSTLSSGKDVDFMIGDQPLQASPDSFYITAQRKLGKGKVVPVKLEFSLGTK